MRKIKEKSRKEEQKIEKIGASRHFSLQKSLIWSQLASNSPNFMLFWTLTQLFFVVFMLSYSFVAYILPLRSWKPPNNAIFAWKSIFLTVSRAYFKKFSGAPPQTPRGAPPLRTPLGAPPRGVACVIQGGAQAPPWPILGPEGPPLARRKNERGDPFLMKNWWKTLSKFKIFGASRHFQKGPPLSFSIFDTKNFSKFLTKGSPLMSKIFEKSGPPLADFVRYAPGSAPRPLARGLAPWTPVLFAKSFSLARSWWVEKSSFQVDNRTPFFQIFLGAEPPDPHQGATAPWTPFFATAHTALASLACVRVCEVKKSGVKKIFLPPPLKSCTVRAWRRPLVSLLRNLNLNLQHLKILFRDAHTVTLPFYLLIF